MKKFFVRLFAVVGVLTTLVFGMGILAAVYVKNGGASKVEAPKAMILTLDMDRPIVEQATPSPFDLATKDDPVQLLDILHALDIAQKDPRVKGVVARFGSTQPTFAQAQEIRAAIQRFRESKKFTYAYGTSYGSYGLGNRAYYLASAFEDIWLQPVGSVGLSGMMLQSPFAKTALDKIGVTADFMQREEYKSFMEPAMRDDYSPLVRVEMQGLLDNIQGQVADGIAAGRKWDAAHVKDLMAKGPYTDEEALKEKLVTRLAYMDELDDAIDKTAGKDAKWVDVNEYLTYVPHTDAEPKARVALIHGDGMIVDRAVGDDLTGDHFMSADEIAGAFDDATEDKGIKAILFRIDSPGGSPEASETIRRALIHAQKKGKIVYVSMGDVAASGGYWVAMNADRILADPGTLTGSIGVIAGKFSGAGLLQKLGVTLGTIKTDDNAGMWSVASDFTPAQRDRVNAMLDNTYHAFTKNVSEARKIPMEKMSDIAKGRVWTGDQAVKIGLVDELGGYDATIEALRKKLNLAESDTLSLEVFPLPETPVERVMKLLKQFGVESAMMQSTMTQFGSIRAAVAPLLSAVTSPPISARMPSDALRLVR